MTQREREILNWIAENPMISQQELADRAGITRSSVAVHISNLMKKGYIAGKGYVLRTPSYAAVVGGITKDIGGRSLAPLVPRDSNPGQVRISLGGVGWGTTSFFIWWPPPAGSWASTSPRPFMCRVGPPPPICSSPAPTGTWSWPSTIWPSLST